MRDNERRRSGIMVKSVLAVGDGELGVPASSWTLKTDELLARPSILPVHNNVPTPSIWSVGKRHPRRLFVSGSIEAAAGAIETWKMGGIVT